MIWLFNMKWLWVEGIVLWPFVLIRHSRAATPHWLVNHEKKHVEQVYRHWIIGFYALYLWHYLVLRLSGESHEQAYLLNPFEREARKAE